MTRACYASGMVPPSKRPRSVHLSDSDRAELEALRDELAANERERDAIVEKIATTATAVKARYETETNYKAPRGIHTEVATALGRTRNNLYQLIKDGELIAFKREREAAAEKQRQAQAGRRARSGRGPEFLSPEQHQSTK